MHIFALSFVLQGKLLSSIMDCDISHSKTLLHLRIFTVFKCESRHLEWPNITSNLF